MTASKYEDPTPTLWHEFRSISGELPPLGRYVLCQLPSRNEHSDLVADTHGPGATLPPSIAVGYLKHAAGDPQCPYFVIPGVGGVPTHWCDCLGDDFHAPLWATTKRRKRSVDVCSTDPAGGHRVQCAELVNSQVCPISGDLILSVAGDWNDPPVHPYDDPTTTTWEWLESVGWNRVHASYQLAGFVIDRDAMLYRQIDKVAIAKVATRGRVRMAAELLGIRLREHGNE